MAKKSDWLVVISAVILFVVGGLIIFQTPGGFFYRQLLWLALGLAAFFACLFLPVKVFYISAYPLYFIAVSLLVLVLVFAARRPHRWFDLGIMSFQPSELARMAVVFALARYLSKKDELEFRFADLTVPVIIVLVPALLVVVEPDLGSLGTFLVVLAFVLYWQGLSLFYIFLLFSPLVSLVVAFSFIAWAVYFVILLVVLFWRAGFYPALAVGTTNGLAGLFTPLIWHKLVPYQKVRILGFLAPWLDPKGVGWHLVQSKVTLGSGRLFGKGLFSASQHRLGFLPNAHTDFIFATIGEAFGFIGCVLVLGLFMILIYKYFAVAREARNRFASLLACGFGALLFYSVFANIGVVIGILPITGIPLPFTSYGGSSLVVNSAIAGIILNLTRHRFD
jgi:rod shape determining protein RodA